MSEVWLGRMTWPEVEERLKETDVALLPTGAIEQHGPHLPLETDIAIAEALAVRIAEAVAQDVKAVVAPSLPIGASAASMNFPGSLTLDELTLLDLWEQAAKGLIHHGFTKVIVVNGHGGNRAMLSTLMRRIQRQTGAFMAMMMSIAVSPDLVKQSIEAESGQWGHAGEIETSLALALGLRVEMDRAVNEVLEVQEELSDYWPFNDRKVPIPFTEPHDDWEAAGWQGVLGDARQASLEKGERLRDAAVKIGADLVRNAHALSVSVKPFSFP